MKDQGILHIFYKITTAGLITRRSEVHKQAHIYVFPAGGCDDTRAPIATCHNGTDKRALTGAQ